MDLDSPVQEIIDDIGSVVKKYTDRHSAYYLKYSELVEKSRLGQYSLNGELREWIPIIDVDQVLSERHLPIYDKNRGRYSASQTNRPNSANKHDVTNNLSRINYFDLDDVASSIVQEYAEKIQLCLEKSLIDKKFDKYKLEREYTQATNRPYVLANMLAFGGTTVGSAFLLGMYCLPYDSHVNTMATASIMGTIIGSVGMVAESWYHPLGKVLKPFAPLMMLDYAFKDMTGTSIHLQKLKLQYAKKLSNYLKRNPIEKKMRA